MNATTNPTPSVPHILILFLMLSTSLWSYSGGNGTWQNPYQLSVPEDLIELGNDLDNYDKNFVLTHDIDLSEYFFQEAVIASAEQVSANHGDGFSGSLLGKGHLIKNLNVSGASRLGLIGKLESSGHIHGLGIMAANITATQKYVGLLVGVNEGTLSQCFTEGFVQGQEFVGGLVGFNQGTFMNCYTQGEVQGQNYLGGLSGMNAVGDVINCYSACLMTCTDPNNSGRVFGLTRNSSSIHSFWDSEISGIEGTDGLPTAAMMDANTFIEVGWDFLNEIENGSYDIWMEPVMGGYPTLSVFYGHQAPWPSDQGVTWGIATLSEDPNQVLWNSEDVFLSQWQRTSAHCTLDVNGVTEKSLSIDATLTVLDSNNLVAIDASHFTVCRAFDEQGDAMVLQSQTPGYEPQHNWLVSPIDSVQYSLDLRLDPNQAMPSQITQIGSLAYALYAQSFVQADLPLEVSADWINLAPGFRVKITQVDRTANTCQYTLVEEIEGINIRYGSLSGDEGGYGSLGSSTPGSDWNGWDVLYDCTHIDSQGNSVNSGSTAIQGTRSNGLLIQTIQRTIPKSDVETIRYSIAMHPYTLLVPLILEEIPVLY